MTGSAGKGVLDLLTSACSKSLTCIWRRWWTDTVLSANSVLFTDTKIPVGPWSFCPFYYHMNLGKAVVPLIQKKASFVRDGDLEDFP